MKNYKNILNENDISQLLDYNQHVDDRSDIRPDVASKHPRWNIDVWPQAIIEGVLNNILDYDYQVEEVIFNTSKVSFRLHVDSGHSPESLYGDVVLIPLFFDGTSHTVFFDNFWFGNSTKFSKEDILPYEYRLLNKQQNWQYVPDIRELLKLAKENPKQIIDFTVNKKFIDDLEYLVAARSNKKISQVDNRCYDYTQIKNYNPSVKFNKELHRKYLSHIAIESLHGLTVSDIFDWKVGDCVVFERSRLHCASSCHKEKTGISIFTKRM